MSYKAMWQQYYPSHAPTFTEADLIPGSHVGKVYLITGANSGIGLQLVKFLYPTGATIYLAGRSSSKISKAISDIESTSSNLPSKGILKPLPGLDLSDLRTIKPVVETFASQETQLHILWNNAASGFHPGASTPQGHEACIGTNAVGPFLFTSLLLPYLSAGSKSSTQPSRVIWTGSIQIEMNAPPGGIDFERLSSGKTVLHHGDYAQSKCANLLLAHEAAARWGASHNVLSVCINPGNLNTNIFHEEPWLLVLLLRWLVLYEPRFGAYTMMFAGFSEQVTMAQNGCYVWPWGVIKENSRQDVYKAIGEGLAGRFWEWCEERVAEFK
ncbi:NAD(P)-binding protein [Periconia macrospinosa]|uniref:NAD(P)-binding protein n=1 Tax=Periconia macrospinosa TaxID=97972 RepID=A0A2V1E3G1_9PLEO|nr:NAD(P)-binding protein [Periconia macrospinosa]